MEADRSFDGQESIDLTSVIAEFPNGDDHPGKLIPIKKLSEVFDSCVKGGDNSMKVFLRVRPAQKKEETTITIESDFSIVTNAPEGSKRAMYTKTESRNYIFNRVFGPDSEQNEVYQHAVEPLLEKFYRGDNCVLFAYGMTNAGKTYTIQGSLHNPGILPRLVSSILDKMDQMVEPRLNISMLEIYQEKIYDLLARRRENLSIRDANGRVEVAKLSHHPVKSTTEAFMLMDTAASKRSKSNTLLNTGSSRSHAVYTITLTQLVSGKEQSVAFQLIDLAGAERSNRTKATWLQQKEANNINTSLMQLWRCLHGMKKKSDNSGDMIPFRESKLTHLLMPILGRAGLKGVGMITCVNPQVSDYDETISILGNASLASKIREIVDVGRVAAQECVSSSVATTTDLNSTSGSQRNGESTKPVDKKGKPEVVGNKRRRNESTISESSKSSRDSMACSAREGAIKKQQNAVQSANDDLQAKLMRQIEDLKKENALMTQAQLTREAEIRAEVSEEMVQRSNQLLTQIQMLRTKVAQFESSNIVDVTKSVKKARKQFEQDNEVDAEAALHEAEQEMIRMKSMFEEEINLLKEENSQLHRELAASKDPSRSNSMNSACTSDSTSEGSKKVRKGKGSMVKPPNPNTEQVATEFSQRMQRDARFKKNESSIYNDENSSAPTAIPKKSPNRSPLTAVSRNIDNSPNFTRSNSPQKPGRSVSPQKNAKPDFIVSKTSANTNRSPQRLRTVGNMCDENKAPAGISSTSSNNIDTMYTRLRSQLGRV